MEDCIRATDINLIYKESEMGEGGKYKTGGRLII